MQVDGCERMWVCVYGRDGCGIAWLDVYLCGWMRNCMDGCVRMWVDRDYISELVDVYKCDLEISFINS
jgi:hypothetical protein